MTTMLKKDGFFKQLLDLVLPITIQAFMLSLVSATDAVMLGFVDQASLSAVSLAGQIQFILNMFISGFSTGSAILIAQYWGKKDVNTIEKAIPIALRLNLIVTGLFTVAAAAFPEFLMKIYTDDATLIPGGAAYLRAVSLSYVLCGISQVYLTALKNTGKAKKASLISSTAVVINILVNALLIFGMFGLPKLGIVGAAYATVAARLVEFVWSFIETKRPGSVRVRWSKIFAKTGILEKDFWRYTLPVLGAALVWGVAYSMYSVLMGHMGSDAVAANSIASIVKGIASCVIRGLAGATGILIGNLLGANELATAKDYGKRITILSWIVGAVTGLIMIIVLPIVLHFSTLSEGAVYYLKWMTIISAVNVIFQSVNATVLDGIFCSGGDSKFDMIGNIFSMWLCSVPIGFLCTFVFKIPPLAVYCIVHADEIIKMPAVFLRYRQYIWLRNITRDE